MEPAKIVIASAPNGFRMTLAEEMGRCFPEELAIKTYELSTDPHIQGVNTDYRYMLKLAAEMVTWENKLDMPTIFTHSILDGLVHTLMAIERHAKFDNVSEYEKNKWLSILGVMGCMFRDSFNPDLILFVDLYDEEDEDLYEHQELIKMVLNEFGIPFETLREDWFDKSQGLIQKVLDDKRRDSTELTE